MQIHQIDTPDIQTLKYADIYAVMLAEGGAMGEAGALVVIEKKKDGVKISHANYVYGSFDMNVFAQVFTPLQTFQCGIFGKASGIAPGWRHIDLGAGNHLLVRDCIYPEFEKRTRQMTPPEKFQSYLKICTELQDLHR